MKSIKNFRAGGSRNLLLAQILGVLFIASAFLTSPVVTENASAQTTCRTASSLSAGQVARAFVTRLGVNAWQVRFELNSNHAMFCDGSPVIFCNRDKFAFKQEVTSTNIFNVSSNGTENCNTFWQFNTSAGNPSTWSFGIKIRFQENFFNGFSNGNPKRLVAQLVVNAPSGSALSIYDQEVEVTDQLVTLPDDGID